MDRPAPGLRRTMMTSLASRIGFFVFAATLVSALAVAGTSALAVRTFLRAQTEGRVPEAAVRARDRLELWYAQRALDVVKTVAHHRGALLRKSVFFRRGVHDMPVWLADDEGGYPGRRLEHLNHRAGVGHDLARRERTV